MTMLLTEAEARRHLRLGPEGIEDEDQDLRDKIAGASSIFLEYHSDGAIPEEWTTGSPAELDPALVPEAAKEAVALILHRLWDGRGEDPMEHSYPLQRMLRGPALS